MRVRERVRLRTLAIVAVLLAGASRAAAQAPVPDSSGTVRLTVPSRVLGEARRLDVTLPRGYAAGGDARHPMVVVPDGESEGEVAAAVARFYGDAGVLPDVIVVAVHNRARTRDLTPAAVAPFVAPSGPSGGADRFLDFLADEALPLVERSYRVAPMRVLVGHSLGGLLALHALARRPSLFTGYVIMEPAAWWNREQPLRDARAALARPDARRARVMLVNAPPLWDDTASWGGERPMVRHVRVADETHASMAAVGIASGLRRLFEDFRPAQWRPGTRPVAMLARYDSLAARIGYAVPIPAEAFETVARMSLDARHFDDAARTLDRVERAIGASGESRALRARLARERAAPPPPGFVPLEFPARRPTPAQAARFLGRWRSVDAQERHEIEVRASGDTIVVHDRIDVPQGAPYEADDPVVQVTDDGVLEWGLPFFRGLAALVVLRATPIGADSLEVRREARGWVPRDPSFDARRVVRFVRVREAAPR